MADISKIKLPDGVTYNVKDNTKVAKVGDTVTGSINRESGGSWILARDNCVVKQTKQTQGTGSSWNPVVGIKTWAGHWSFGTVGGESLCLSYDTDSDYSTSTNNSKVLYFPSAGSDGTLALTSQIPTNNSQLTNGAGYITSSGSCAYATSAGSASPTSGSAYYIQNNVGSSRATTTSGSWISMLNSTQTGSPTLPTSSQWWTVLSADCWNSSPYNWMSQLAIATQDTNGVWWRRNDSADASIDSSTWHRLAEGDSDGNAVNANKVNNLTVQTAVPANAEFTDTKVTQTAVAGTESDHYSILLSNTSNSTSTETSGVKKTRYGKMCYNPNNNKIVNVSGISITNNDNNSNRLVLDTWMDGGFISLFDTDFSPTIQLKGANGFIQTTGTVSANSVTCNSISVQDISDQYTFTRTAGPWTYQGIRAVRCGNVVTMQIIIKGGSAVSAGSNGIVGTFSGGPLPARVNGGTQDMGVYGVNFYGVSALVGTLNSSGNFTLRLLINSQSLGGKTTSIGFTFVCD